MPAVIDVRGTLGALLIGCFFAVLLSGLVAFQACIYLRLYPSDKLMNKVMVIVVWVLDTIHTCLICTSIWIYLISNYGNVEGHLRGEIPITVSLSIGVTSFVTLITHLYFLRRLLQLSKNNWFIVGPTLFLAIGRVACGLTTTAELIRVKTFPAYTQHYSVVFTLGLSISSVVDVVITSGMCYYLQESRRGFGTMDEVIDSIIVYTINNGTLTCIATIVSTILWLFKGKNLVFMAMHFAIAKMYANSLFATLNMRKKFRGRAAPPKENANAMPVIFPDSFNRFSRNRQGRTDTFDFPEVTVTDTKTLHVTIEKTVDYDGGKDQESGPSSEPNYPSPLDIQMKHEVV
ncbi:hypothetical protein F5148DRAFT_107997 [Russula earlei]|uniref:Uncharacterized protein n=1 Tax=Russula earlei TaxID=71964 RepID=A0ACC0U8E8_9AGAM|nr:hypothetical protein F5148DRAFT_107997 [Russula earlei]